jgi:hypothetical protein
MEIGLTTGLAQSMQYDQRIADARYQNDQFKRAQAENQASLKAFEDDMDYMNAANSFDHDLIKAEADKTIREIGAIIRDNPDYQYDPNVRRIINEKKKYLKDNNHVRRGMASDGNFKRLNDDLAKVAKNPNMYDAGAYQELLAKKNNYLQFGHQDGKEAAEKFGPQAFVYDKPEDFVPLNEEALKTAQMIKARKYKQHGNGGWEELIDENALTPAAMDFYNRHKRQIQVTYNPKDDAEGIAYAAELIKPGIDLKRKFGEPHYNDALAVAKWKAAHDEAKSSGKYNIDPFSYDIKKLPVGSSNTLNTDLVTSTLGTTPEARIYNKDGSLLTTTKGLKFIPSGSFQKARTVEKTAPYKTADGKTHYYKQKEGAGDIGVYHGYVEMTEDELDSYGIANDKAMDGKITPYEGKDVKGNKVKMYRVEANVQSSLNNEAQRLRYNQAAKLTNQQMNSLNPINQTEQSSNSFNGLPVGAIVQKAGINYLVTPQGLIQQ